MDRYYLIKYYRHRYALRALGVGYQTRVVFSKLFAKKSNIERGKSKLGLLNLTEPDYWPRKKTNPRAWPPL